jgi:hypothetical protein
MSVRRRGGAQWRHDRESVMATTMCRQVGKVEAEREKKMRERVGMCATSGGIFEKFKKLHVIYNHTILN